MRKKFDADLKAKVALEVFRGEKALAQIASEYDVHPNQISRWRKGPLKGAVGVFRRGGQNSQDNQQQEQTDKLHHTLRELKVENDWLKKIKSFGLKEKQAFIDRDDGIFTQRK